jgi:hypothetical protein
MIRRFLVVLTLCGADNVCDPTGGFTLTENTRQNFGKIILERGHRVVEFALKLYF